MRKSFKIVLVLLISLLFSSYVFAGTPVAKGDATMKLVEDNVCDIKFGEYGTFQKKMTNIDTENKTVDITLTATNADKGTHTHTETKTSTEDIAGEVVLLIDSSNSMSVNPVTVNGQETTRKKLVLDSANSLVDKLFQANSKIKIGVVEFATSTDTSKEGTSEDAKIVTPTLLNDSAKVKEALTTVSTDKMGPRTDIQVGLETADSLLATSSDTNAKKYIILLTDAIPNTSKGVTFDTYSDATAVPTKETLVAIKNKGINVISMLINMSDSQIQISQENPKPTYKQVAQKIFGTITNPTAGPVYYVEDKDVTKTVTENIYADLVPETTTTTVEVEDEKQYKLTDIVIKDYFPANIVQNFEFATLKEATKGNISAKIDTSDNSITWTISELVAGETATFTYRLSLKDSFDSDIVGKNLPTNENVTVDYKEDGVQGEQKQNDKCPIIALDVQATKDIPQTGSNTWLAVGTLVALSVIIAGISHAGYTKKFNK